MVSQVVELHAPVPNFILQDDAEATRSLEEFRGTPVVLFFYPKADTPGCTLEACGFRDAFAQLQEAGVVVLGISRDTSKAQAKFRAKYQLPYTLLADVNAEVCTLFGVLKEKNMYGKKVIGIERSTYLIAPDGTLAKIWARVKPEGHAEEVLAVVREM